MSVGAELDCAKAGTGAHRSKAISGLSFMMATPQPDVGLVNAPEHVELLPAVGKLVDTPRGDISDENEATRRAASDFNDSVMPCEVRAGSHLIADASPVGPEPAVRALEVGQTRRR